MLIYGSLFLVFIVTLVFYFLKPKEYTWWEFFIPFGITGIVILITKLIIDYSSVQFTEYWGSNISYVVEEEPYNYWHSETCSYESCTGSGENRVCTKIYYDCSHQVDVSPEWYAVTTIGETINLSEKQHDILVKQFGTERKIINQRENYDSNDRATGSRGTKFEGKCVGNISSVYMTKWNGSDETSKSITTRHSYENRIKASDLSIFNIQLVKENDADSLKLFKYPELNDYLEYPTILGLNNNNIQEKYKKLNGKFGPQNKLRLWILIFKDKPAIIANYQENYWVKGNKNELIICFGVDKQNNIQWTHSFSWANSNVLTADVKQKALDLKVLNDSTWNNYYNYLNNNLNKFQKRSFKEFDYLTVEPSKTAIIITYIIALIITIFCNIWLSSNEYDSY